MNKKLQNFLATNKDKEEDVKDTLFGFITFKQLGRGNDLDYPIIGSVKTGIPVDICLEIWKEGSEIECLRWMGIPDEEIYLEGMFLVGRYHQDFPSQVTFANLIPVYNKIHEMNRRIDEKQQEIKEKLKDLNDYLDSI